MSMKNISVILFSAICMTAMVSCDDVKREPGAIYMPDMTYSRGYETYLERDTAYFTMDPSKSDDKIFYIARPVAGYRNAWGGLKFSGSERCRWRFYKLRSI